MGLMNFLRNRAGVVIVSFIGFAIVAFLLGDVISYGTPFWARGQNQVGSINGKEIEYNEFSAFVDQTTEMYRQQMGGAMNPQMRTWAVEQVWSQLVNRELLQAEIDKIGLSVGKSELNDLVHGDNPSHQILQAFSNPQTGQFDREQLLGFASQVRTLPANHEAVMQWNALLDNVVEERQSMKYHNLINNSVYVTALEAEDEYIQANKSANFEYVLLDYASVSDDQVTVTDADYRAYYNEHKNQFVHKEETRDLAFVLFDARPKAGDTARVREQVSELGAQLAQSTADSLFSAVNSDSKYPYAYQPRGRYSPGLDSLLFTEPVGSVVGPVLSGDVWETAKIIDRRMSPDSIQASHILLNPMEHGGVTGTETLADSIRSLILNGENFGALALQFSIDEGNKFNGGSLGTFSRGQMVPGFEEPVFEGRKGDVLIINTQFGTHIVHIEETMGSSQVVKAAVVDKQILSGKETIDSAYAAVTSFFVGLSGKNLNEYAREEGVEVRRSFGIDARESMLEGVPVKRELIRWAFDAKKGEVSDQIYESENGDYYVVAQVSDVHKKGQQSLDDVRSDIAPDVLQKAKAQKLKEDMKAASVNSASLSAVAQNLGANTVSAENIVMANPIIPGVAFEPAVIGAVFGSELNTPSGPIEGSQGVYMVEVHGFVNPEAANDLTEQRLRMQQARQQRAQTVLFQALESKAKIVDNRARFF